MVTPTLIWYRKCWSVMSHYWVYIKVTGVKRAVQCLQHRHPNCLAAINIVGVASMLPVLCKKEVAGIRQQGFSKIRNCFFWWGVRVRLGQPRDRTQQNTSWCLIVNFTDNNAQKHEHQSSAKTWVLLLVPPCLYLSLVFVKGLMSCRMDQSGFSVKFFSNNICESALQAGRK